MMMYIVALLWVIISTTHWIESDYEENGEVFAASEVENDTPTSA